jgi:PAS domain S-box-containing protein
MAGVRSTAPGKRAPGFAACAEVGCQEGRHVNKTLHDMRNDLAVAIASLEAFVDGKLEPNHKNFGDILEALGHLDGLISELRPRSPAVPAKAAAASGDLFNLVVEAAPNAMVLVNERGRITLVNVQTEKLFGYTRSELLGQSIEMLVPERFRRGHTGLRDSFNEAAVARPMGAGRDLYGRRKDGSEVPVEIGLNPISTGGATLTLAAITDITERKRAEELRLLHAGVQQHASELEEVNRELASASRFKTQFVATMSHELRTPLTAIIGAAELLGKAKLGEHEQISVLTINEAAEALFSLINSILDFSKIEAGKIDLHPTIFEVETVLEGAADVVAQLAREKGITLHAYVDPIIPPVEGDADRLRQILLNLLGNAVKFTENGRVVARVVPVEIFRNDVVLRFEVQDTGIGIAAAVLPRLFEPFAQADGPTARRFGGTGLGLSISKRLVELMGGEIGAQSIDGDGSLFWFTARFARAPLMASVPARKLNGIGGLILSGDELFVQIVERYMTSWSMRSRRVLSRGDVTHALKSADGPTWVVVADLDDIGLPDIGLTIDALHAIVPDRVVAIGQDGLLRKPIRASSLFDAITNAVDAKHGHPHLVGEIVEPDVTPLTNGRVLVAEDNARLLRLLKLQFDELGVPVTFVSDGFQAIEALRNERYSLVFMDCQMPNLDGISATKAIREEERRTGGHVPITAMTANAFSEDRDACIAAGMDDYLAKPVRLGDLRTIIERWSNRSVRN